MSLRKKVEELRHRDFGSTRDLNTARWVTDEESIVLQALIQDNHIKTVIETGTANGFSALAMSEYAEKVYTFDPIDRLKIWDMGIDFKGNPQRISYFQSSLNRKKDFLFSQIIEQPVLFFIDGDHSSSGVLNDWENIKDYVIKYNSIIAFHDWNIPSVQRAWDRNIKNTPGASFLKIITPREFLIATFGCLLNTATLPKEFKTEQVKL